MFSTILLALTLVGPMAAPAAAPAATPVPAASMTHDLVEPILTKTELQRALRDLWTGHVFWIRSVVVATHYNDDAAAKVAEDKAVENARALADGIAPFYGQEAADKLFDLLAGHYGAVKEYMVADFKVNKSATNAAAKKIVDNAGEIATFLGAANPYLPKDAVLPLLVAHGGHHMQQIQAIRLGHFAQEADTWSAMLDHVHAIGDAMGDALARQFPAKVAG